MFTAKTILLKFWSEQIFNPPWLMKHDMTTQSVSGKLNVCLTMKHPKYYKISYHYQHPSTYGIDFTLKYGMLAYWELYASRHII